MTLVSLDEEIEEMILCRVMNENHPGNAPVRLLNKLVDNNYLVPPEHASDRWNLGPKANYYLGYLRRRRGERPRDL